MSDLNAKCELLNCELSEQELNNVTGAGKNQTKGASPRISESISLSYEEAKFEYTEQ